MLSLLYISKSCLTPGEDARQLQAILDVAARRNRSLSITGALVFTGADFAQILEGPEDSVANVMASILIDQRHETVSIVRREEVARRSFPNWGMALIGHDPATAEHIQAIRRAPSADAHGGAVDAVTEWMRRGATGTRPLAVT